MNRYSRKKPLISIHIPKCAGTSFSRVLQVWFKDGFRSHYFDELNNKPPKKHELFHRRFLFRKPIEGLCIHGHFNRARGFGVCDYYPSAQQFISILREPFELHVSEYFYVRRMADQSRSKVYRGGNIHPIIANGWSLADYLQNVSKSKIGDFLPAEIDKDNFKQVLKRNFLYIGVAERLQESVDELSGILGFDSVTVPQLNESKRVESTPPSARSKFERCNELEMTIYQFVRDDWRTFPEQADCEIDL